MDSSKTGFELETTLNVLRKGSTMHQSDMTTDQKPSIMKKRHSNEIEEFNLEDDVVNGSKTSKLHRHLPLRFIDSSIDAFHSANQPGFGIGKLRYRFMTPEEFSDEDEPNVCDMMNAFRDVTTAHGIPHVGNAKGRRFYEQM